MNTPKAVREWLRTHTGETFTTKDIADEYQVKTQAVSASLVELSNSGQYALTRINRTTWTHEKSDGALRVVRESPLRPGARLEVVGATLSSGTTIARDAAGRLWVVTPLEIA